MNRMVLIKLLPFLVLINTIFSVNAYSKFPLENTFVVWGVNFLLIYVVVWGKLYFFYPSITKDYQIIWIYFIWMILGVVRGMFVAENYWEWKQWVDGATTLTLPVFVFIFSIPWILRKTLAYWLKYAMPLFFLFFSWGLKPTAYHFYLGPVFLLACFLPVIEKKWQTIFIILLLSMIFVDFGARSQVLKSTAVLAMSGAYLAARYLSDKILKILHWCFYILPIVFISLGLSGLFNIFQELSSNKGKYIERRIVNGYVEEEDLSADTRTPIYVDVVESALKHGYILWGRTPARGNDSYTFGLYKAEELKTGKYERHSNELCFTNVFTWLGLIGMILYCLIYLKASYLSLYKSRNIFMKLVGVFVAFRFAYGWIEDFNRFDIMNISLWMMIAMGFSEQFRAMNNSEFKVWVRSIFGLNTFRKNANNSSDKSISNMLKV